VLRYKSYEQRQSREIFVVSQQLSDVICIAKQTNQSTFYALWMNYTIVDAFAVIGLTP